MNRVPDLIQSAMHIGRVFSLQVEDFDRIPNNMVLTNLLKPKRLDADRSASDFRVPDEETRREALAFEFDVV